MCELFVAASVVALAGALCPVWFLIVTIGYIWGLLWLPGAKVQVELYPGLVERVRTSLAHNVVAQNSATIDISKHLNTWNTHPASSPFVLLLGGPTGTGKTHCGRSVALGALNRDGPLEDRAATLPKGAYQIEEGDLSKWDLFIDSLQKPAEAGSLRVVILDDVVKICNKKKSVCQKLSSLMNSNNVDKANIIFILAFEVPENMVAIEDARVAKMNRKLKPDELTDMFRRYVDHVWTELYSLKKLNQPVVTILPAYRDALPQSFDLRVRRLSERHGWQTWGEWWNKAEEDLWWKSLRVDPAIVQAALRPDFVAYRMLTHSHEPRYAQLGHRSHTSAGALFLRLNDELAFYFTLQKNRRPKQHARLRHDDAPNGKKGHFHIMLGFCSSLEDWSTCEWVLKPLLKYDGY